MSEKSYLETHNIKLTRFGHSELIECYAELIEKETADKHNPFRIVQYDYHKDKQLVENELIRRMRKGDWI